MTGMNEMLHGQTTWITWVTQLDNLCLNSAWPLQSICDRHTIDWSPKSLLYVTEKTPCWTKCWCSSLCSAKNGKGCSYLSIRFTHIASVADALGKHLFLQNTDLITSVHLNRQMAFKSISLYKSALKANSTAKIIPLLAQKKKPSEATRLKEWLTNILSFRSDCLWQLAHYKVHGCGPLSPEKEGSVHPEFSQ